MSTVYDPLADYLVSGYWESTGRSARKFDVGPGDTLDVNISALSVAGQEFALAALQFWSDVTGIIFNVVGGAADITFGDDDVGGGAYAQSIVSGGFITQSFVEIEESWIASDVDGTGHAIFNDSYSLQTYIHEIGHALGLGHAGPYNGSATYATDAIFETDSWQATIMSYFHQGENTDVIATPAYVLTPQIADILAIQAIYGVPTTTRTGDTVYGYNSTAGGLWDDFMTFVDTGVAWATFTIFDSGGIDTVDFSDTSFDQLIDLNEGGISNIAGAIGNVIIAYGVTIENAIGGNGADEIIGNDVANNIQGGFGNDEIEGAGGADIIFGNQGNDYIDGGDGGDSLIGGLGRDRILGGDGADSIRGGGGNDVLKGQAGDDTIWGGSGNDVIYGGTGSDIMIGGAGADLFIFKENDIVDSGVDTIRDFEDDVDVIEIHGYTDTDVAITDLGGGVYEVDVDGHIINVTMSSGVLSIDDFVFV